MVLLSGRLAASVGFEIRGAGTSVSVSPSAAGRGTSKELHGTDLQCGVQTLCPAARQERKQRRGRAFSTAPGSELGWIRLSLEMGGGEYT